MLLLYKVTCKLFKVDQFDCLLFSQLWKLRIIIIAITVRYDDNSIIIRK